MRRFADVIQRLAQPAQPNRTVDRPTRTFVWYFASKFQSPTPSEALSRERDQVAPDLDVPQRSSVVPAATDNQRVQDGQDMRVADAGLVFGDVSDSTAANDRQPALHEPPPSGLSPTARSGVLPEAALTEPTSAALAPVPGETAHDPDALRTPPANYAGGEPDPRSEAAHSGVGEAVVVHGSDSRSLVTDDPAQVAQVNASRPAMSAGARQRGGSRTQLPARVPGETVHDVDALQGPLANYAGGEPARPIPQDIPQAFVVRTGVGSPTVTDAPGPAAAGQPLRGAGLSARAAAVGPGGGADLGGRLEPQPGPRPGAAGSGSELRRGPLSSALSTAASMMAGVAGTVSRASPFARGAAAGGSGFASGTTAGRGLLGAALRAPFDLLNGVLNGVARVLPDPSRLGGAASLPWDRPDAPVRATPDARYQGAGSVRPATGNVFTGDSAAGAPTGAAYGVSYNAGPATATFAGDGTSPFRTTASDIRPGAGAGVAGSAPAPGTADTGGGTAPATAGMGRSGYRGGAPNTSGRASDTAAGTGGSVPSPRTDPATAAASGTVDRVDLDVADSGVTWYESNTSDSQHWAPFPGSPTSTTTGVDRGWSTSQGSAAGGQVQHRRPQSISDFIALVSAKLPFEVARWLYGNQPLMYARTVETLGGLPPMVSAFARFLWSERNMSSDQHVREFLEQAERERTHLLTWTDLTNPGRFDRLLAMGMQGGYLLLFSLLHLASSRTAARASAYMDEEAVQMYDKLLAALDQGKLPNGPAPALAVARWNLDANATIRDVVLAIRNEEADFCSRNHSVSDNLSSGA